jgi:hypothetical protein
MPPLPTARSTRRGSTSRPQRLEDRPDHHKEIQTPIHLDILTFYIWDQFSQRILTILQFFIFVLSLITRIGDHGSKYRFRHITSICQVVYVQRIRCSKNCP